MTLSWPRALVLVFAAHLVFGGVRLFYSAYAKRYREVAEWYDRGELGYQFRFASAESTRLAQWLCDTVPADHAVLYAGEVRGRIQILAALLAPRVLVHADAVPSAATSAAGRPLFREHPPWMNPPTGSLPVVIGEVEELGLQFR